MDSFKNNIEDYSKMKYIDNSILFFIYDKVDCMRDGDISMICKDFYTEDEIVDAKKIVFKVYSCEEDCVMRRGASKITQDIGDIKIVRTRPSLNDVKFCVTSTRHLPPVALDHNDVSAMLKQMMDLRTEVIKMK